MPVKAHSEIIDVESEVITKNLEFFTKNADIIIYQMHSEDFNRLRIGIATDDDMRPSEKYVLSPFQYQDEEIKNEMIEKACEGINYYFSHNMKETMNQFNKKGVNE